MSSPNPYQAVKEGRRWRVYGPSREASIPSFSTREGAEEHAHICQIEDMLSRKRKEVMREQSDRQNVEVAP